MLKRIQHIFNKTWSNNSAKGSKLFWISLIVVSSNSKVIFMLKVYSLVKSEQNWRSLYLIEIDTYSYFLPPEITKVIASVVSIKKVNIAKTKNTQHIFNKTLSNNSEKGSKLHWMSLNVFSSNYKVSCMMKVYPLVKSEKNWRSLYSIFS